MKKNTGAESCNRTYLPQYTATFNATICIEVYTKTPFNKRYNSSNSVKTLAW